jgi:neurotrimin
MIISNDKYQMSEINSSAYSVQMRLIVRNIQKSDLGGYKCISKNSIGDAEGNIRLYGKLLHHVTFIKYIKTMIY